MQRIKYFFIYFTQLFKAKIIFHNPKKSKILLFDYTNNSILQKTLKLPVEVLYLRLEEINFFIIYKSIAANGLKNITKNYMKTYIEYVKPKVIITFLELHPTFYLVKDIVADKKIIFIAVQDGFRTLPNFKSFNFKRKKEYKSDLIFLFSQEDKKLYSKMFNFKKKILGSFRNNFYKKKNNKKNKKILLISQFREEYLNSEKVKYFSRELLLIKFLKLINHKFKIKFSIATKPGVSVNIYNKTFKLDNKVEIVSDSNFEKKYNLIDRSQLTLFMDSTLGMESLSRGNKVVSFPFKPFKIKENFFWDCDLKYERFEKKVLDIFHLKKKDWDLRVKNKNIFLNYNPGNTILKNFIKSKLI